VRLNLFILRHIIKMQKLNKKKLFLFVSTIYFLIYIFSGFFLTNYSQSDIDYKSFTNSDSCKYNINQIDFYDFEEKGKSYQKNDGLCEWLLLQGR